LSEERNGWAANRSERLASLKRTKTGGDPQSSTRRQGLRVSPARLTVGQGKSAFSQQGIIFLRREHEVNVTASLRVLVLGKAILQTLQHHLVLITSSEEF